MIGSETCCSRTLVHSYGEQKMDETDRQRERSILHVLKGLARQRIALILQPGNVWVIENAVSEKADGVAEDLRTCLLRGWVKVLENAIPRGSLTPEGRLPAGSAMSHSAPLYGLTDSGWNAIHQTHGWMLFACLTAFVSLLVSFTSLLITVAR